MDSRVEMRVLAPNKILVTMKKFKVTISNVSLFTREVENGGVSYQVSLRVIGRVPMMHFDIDTQEWVEQMTNQIQFSWTRFVSLLSNEQVLAFVLNAKSKLGFGEALQTELSKVLLGAELLVLTERLESDSDTELDGVLFENEQDHPIYARLFDTIRLTVEGVKKVRMARALELLKEVPEGTPAEITKMLLDEELEGLSKGSLTIKLDRSSQGAERSTSDASDANDGADADASDASDAE